MKRLLLSMIVCVMLLIGCGAKEPTAPETEVVKADVQEYITELIDKDAIITTFLKSDSRATEDNYMVTCVVEYKSLITEYKDEFVLIYTIRDKKLKLSKCKVNPNYSGKYKGSLGNSTEEKQDSNTQVSSMTTPTPTHTPSPTSTSTPAPTVTPVMNTFYDGTIVELSKANVGDVVLFGTYEQDNIESNGAEDISWYVLDKDADRLLLMSVYLLDYVQYHEKHEQITWEDCTLRQWINEEFYTCAFSKSEEKHILTSLLENGDNPCYGTEGGNATEDKVFVLSLEEVEQYFGIADDTGLYWMSASPELSSAKGTAYAEAQGMRVSSVGTSWWWLRSPGCSDKNATYVDSVGDIYIFGDGVDGKDDFGNAVRPALWLNLNP